MGGRGVGADNTPTPTPIRRALWPLIFERAYRTSAGIYDNSSSSCSMEEKERKKCATGLFHLIRYGPLFVEDNWRQCCCASNREIAAAAAAAAATSLNCDDDASTNNKALKRKRKSKYKRKRKRKRKRS